MCALSMEVKLVSDSMNHFGDGKSNWKVPCPFQTQQYILVKRKHQALAMAFTESRVLIPNSFAIPVPTVLQCSCSIVYPCLSWHAQFNFFQPTPVGSDRSPLWLLSDCRARDLSVVQGRTNCMCPSLMGRGSYRAKRLKNLKLVLLPFQQESLHWMRLQEKGEWRCGMLAVCSTQSFNGVR